MSDYNVFCWKI